MLISDWQRAWKPQARNQAKKGAALKRSSYSSRC